MKKYLIYLMQGQKMCALHALMNAVELAKEHEVKLIFEGQAVLLPKEFEEDKNPLYLKLKEGKQIAGVCKACATMLGSLEDVKNYELPLLEEMNGHAGVKPYTDQGFEVMVF